MRRGRNAHASDGDHAVSGGGFCGLYVFHGGKGAYGTPQNLFGAALVAVLVHLALDGCTVYTVNHLDTVPMLLNGALHRLFLGSMAAVIYLFYQYIAILVQEETGKPRRLG